MFIFFYIDINFRRKFIDVIFNELIIKDFGFQFKIYVLIVLWILSWDKDGLGLFIFEKLSFVLLLFVEFIFEGFKLIESCLNEVDDIRMKIEKNRDCGVERVIVVSDVVIEVFKCLCNVVYYSLLVCQYCFMNKCIEVIIIRVKKWFDNIWLDMNVKYFDLRFFFLLMVFENIVRVEVVVNNGFCVLIYVLDICILGKEQRKICYEIKVRDGCGQLIVVKL